jgi:hypothetical protein
VTPVREFVLNDACLRSSTFPSAQIAALSLVDLSRGIARLVTLRVASAVMRADQVFWELLVAPDARAIDVWRHLQRDPATREEAIFFATMSQKVPANIELADEFRQRLLLMDIKDMPDGSSSALLLCLVAGHIGVSLPTEACWDQDELEISGFELDEEGVEEEFTDRIDHLARAEHAGAIANRHNAAFQKGVTTDTFWAERSEAFPRLDFGLDVENQTRQLDPPSFNLVARRLAELDAACIDWLALGGAQSPYRSKVTGESQSTMGRLAERRAFRDANNTLQVYELHARYGSVGRIHFRLKHNERRIEVGYVGRKLPTVRYKT